MAISISGKLPEEEKKTAKKPGELAAILAQIKKDKGEKTILLGRDVPDVRRIATGVFEWDLATGGGFPCGRYAIIYGPESSMKTSMAYLAIAQAQRGSEECNKAVLIDLEHTFDPKWAVLFGVDVDRLIVVKPGYGEEAVDIVDAVVRADDVAIVVVDSLAMVVSSKEVQQSVEKFDVGTAPTLVKRMVNKITIALSEEAKRGHDPCIIFINQTRMKIGVMFGNPETMPGGQTMKFLSSLTIRVQGKNAFVKEISPDTPAFKTVTAQIVKAKVGIVRSNFEFDLALQKYGDLNVGESASWGLVKNELQASGLLVKNVSNNSYALDGSIYKTLSTIEGTYYAEKEFAMHLQDLVIKKYAGKKIVFDSTAKVEAEEQGQMHVG